MVCLISVGELNKNGIYIFFILKSCLADAGSDAANISTTAQQDGDFFILNGKKAWYLTLRRNELLIIPKI